MWGIPRSAANRLYSRAMLMIAFTVDGLIVILGVQLIHMANIRRCSHRVLDASLPIQLFQKVWLLSLNYALRFAGLLHEARFR